MNDFVKNVLELYVPREKGGKRFADLHTNNTKKVVNGGDKQGANDDKRFNASNIKKDATRKADKPINTSMDEEYKPQEGDRVRIQAPGKKHHGKLAWVHQTSPSGLYYGVKDKNDHHIGYYAASELKKHELKEAEETLDELSKKTLGSYVQKASQNLATNMVKQKDAITNYNVAKNTASPDERRAMMVFKVKTPAMKRASAEHAKATNKITNRTMGIGHAVRRLTGLANEEKLDELSKKTLSSYITKAHTDGIKSSRLADYYYDSASTDARTPGDRKKIAAKATKHARRANNRKNGIDLAASRLAKEEVEKLDELSKNTLGRYINAAGQKIRHYSYQAGKAGAEFAAADDRRHKRLRGRGNPTPEMKVLNDKHKQMTGKASRRQRGIETAVSKLTREQVEPIEEAKFLLRMTHVKSGEKFKTGPLNKKDVMDQHYKLGKNSQWKDIKVEPVQTAMRRKRKMAKPVKVFRTHAGGTFKIKVVKEANNCLSENNGMKIGEHASHDEACSALKNMGYTQHGGTWKKDHPKNSKKHFIAVINKQSNGKHHIWAYEGYKKVNEETQPSFFDFLTKVQMNEELNRLFELADSFEPDDLNNLQPVDQKLFDQSIVEAFESRYGEHAERMLAIVQSKLAEEANEEEQEQPDEPLPVLEQIELGTQLEHDFDLILSNGDTVTIDPETAQAIVNRYEELDDDSRERFVQLLSTDRASFDSLFDEGETVDESRNPFNSFHGKHIDQLKAHLKQSGFKLDSRGKDMEGHTGHLYTHHNYQRGNRDLRKEVYVQTDSGGKVLTTKYGKAR